MYRKYFWMYVTHFQSCFLNLLYNFLSAVYTCRWYQTFLKWCMFFSYLLIFSKSGVKCSGALYNKFQIICHKTSIYLLQNSISTSPSIWIFLTRKLSQFAFFFYSSRQRRLCSTHGYSTERQAGCSRRRCCRQNVHALVLHTQCLPQRIRAHSVSTQNTTMSTQLHPDS